MKHSTQTNSRKPVTLTQNPEIHDEEECDGCLRALQRDTDRIHVRVRHRPYNRTVHCDDCHRREEAKMANEHPELFTDRQLAELRDDFPGQFSDSSEAEQ